MLLLEPEWLAGSVSHLVDSLQGVNMLPPKMGDVLNLRCVFHEKPKVLEKEETPGPDTASPDDTSRASKDQKPGQTSADSNHVEITGASGFAADTTVIADEVKECDEKPDQTSDKGPAPRPTARHKRVRSERSDSEDELAGEQG
jgi:hypothetical protein